MTDLPSTPFAMKRSSINLVAGTFFGTLLMFISAFLVYISTKYLSGYVSRPVAIGFGLFAVASGSFVGVIITRAKSCRPAKIASAIFLCGLVMLFASLSIGQTSYQRFGFTLYGAIPIPVFDITVTSDGRLWFRDKNHLIKVDEVRSLLDSEVKVVVIGTGWDEVAKVEPGMENLVGVSVEILSTEKAFQRYNLLKSEGVRVALLAHTTC